MLFIRPPANRKNPRFPVEMATLMSLIICNFARPLDCLPGTYLPLSVCLSDPSFSLPFFLQLIVRLPVESQLAAAGNCCLTICLLSAKAGRQDSSNG